MTEQREAIYRYIETAFRDDPGSAFMQMFFREASRDVIAAVRTGLREQGWGFEETGYQQYRVTRPLVKPLDRGNLPQF
jgi:hypothetical protein